jgi:S-adenosylmethionine:tRNA ribosyltransferase-isomerase
MRSGALRYGIMPVQRCIICIICCDEAGVTINIDDLDYRLPDELIAQSPSKRRDASRLLVFDRADQRIIDSRFTELPDFLTAGDRLVVNNTRVIPAKVRLRRMTGSRIEGLFIRETSDHEWEIMLKGRGRIKPGETLVFEGDELGHTLALVEQADRGTWTARFDGPTSTASLLSRLGETPLPPYIRREGGERSDDSERYQTVFATTPGAVAAPTASLHFTDDVVDRLEKSGVDRTDVTLHVGPGTFAPISTQTLDEHKMHAEWFQMSSTAADEINATKGNGGRIVAAGTTSVRVLESRGAENTVSPGDGWTDIFIFPPYDFAVVNVMLTNFHLPKSTLVALVMAFAGVDEVKRIYRHAVNNRYRFFSYGDAMLIL